MTERLLCSKEVAALFNRGVEWFYKHRKGLEEQGFPKRVAGAGNRWDPEAIDEWRRAMRAAPINGLKPPTVRDELDRDWAAELDERARQLARPH